MSSIPPLGSAPRVPCPRERTLVLCFDGTWDSFDEDNSNIVQLVAMLQKDDPAKQLVYYQAGIGTYTSDVLKTPIIERTSKFVDVMIAWNMPEHIKDGYRFLMQNYRKGDQICIFGFSRGAFTARALACMLLKVGLLPPWNCEQLPFAYDMYRKDDDKGRRLCEEFKRTFSADVKIKFLGVWDTVGSTGLFLGQFPFYNLNHGVLNFRHALSLDEHRVKFVPSSYFDGQPECLWRDDDVSQNGEAIHENGDHRIGRREAPEWPHEHEHRANDSTGSKTDIEEVFFAGVHCDIGGGSVKNGTPNTLARIPLRWMIRECFKRDIGILFDMHMLEHEVGLDVRPILKALSSPKPSEALSSLKPPEVLSSENHNLIKPPHHTAPPGFTFSSIPKAIISTLGSPFCHVWKGLLNLRVRDRRQAAIPPSRLRKNLTSNGEAQEELLDALSPVYDQMKEHTYWKFIDCFPWPYKKSDAELVRFGSLWAYGCTWKFRKGRKVYRQVMPRGMKVHRSVKTRMLAHGMEGEKDKRYLPKIWCEIDGEIRRPTRKEWLAEDPKFFKWWTD